MFRSFALSAVLLSAATLWPLSVHAEGGERVLISHNDVTVTKDDFDRYIELRIPEEHRMATLDRPGAVRQLLAQLLTIRSLARDAEEQVDIDDPNFRWKVDFHRDRILMDTLIERKIEASAVNVDWEELAREHYTANIEEFETPERVRASHVLIGTEERGEDAARELAQEIADRARGGEDITELAREYSDDPSAEQNSGELGWFARGRMVPEFEEAAFALREVGAISDPVETDFGFHVIQLHERSEASARPFERVKPRIIRELQEEHASEVRLEEVERIRGDERIQVNHDAVSELEESLRVDRSGAAERGLDD